MVSLRTCRRGTPLAKFNCLINPTPCCPASYSFHQIKSLYGAVKIPMGSEGHTNGNGR